jgi:hypothetical protein
MAESKRLEELTGKAEVKFKMLGLTDKMYDAVIDYLLEIGALSYCGSRFGCTGGCPSGQSCGRTYRGNCLCYKEP